MAETLVEWCFQGTALLHFSEMAAAFFRKYCYTSPKMLLHLGISALSLMGEFKDFIKP